MCANKNHDLQGQTLIGIAPHLRYVGGLLFLALSASLVGETHFCIGGDVDHLTPASIAACESKLSAIRNAVKLRGAPADWHFVVVCDEAGWKEYTSFSRQGAGMLSGAGYSTDPRLHWTFLRGTDLTTAQPQAAADEISMALNSIPMRQRAPEDSPSGKQARQYGVAMALRPGSGAISQ